MDGVISLTPDSLNNPPRQDRRLRTPLQSDSGSPDFQGLLNSLEGNVAILDQQGTIIATNEAWRSFARENGMNEDPAMVGTNYFSVLKGTDDNDMTRMLNGLQAVLQGQDETFKAVYPCHSPDRKRWFEMRAARLEDEHATYITVTHRDVTERSHYQRDLAEKTEHQTLAQNLVNLGYWTLKLPERTIEGSDEMLRILGFSSDRSDLSLEESLDRFHDQDREEARTQIDQAIDTGTNVDFTLRIVRPDDSIRYVQTHGYPRYDESGEIEDVFGVIQDVTDKNASKLPSKTTRNDSTSSSTISRSSSGFGTSRRISSFTSAQPSKPSGDKPSRPCTRTPAPS